MKNMKPKRIKRNKRNRQRRIDRFKKFLAMFLLVNFLQSIILPTVASALTSGPTAPEATSFEPVDTTDMVNLQTGDFTYNMPLLEVPGPEGGYPLSLAYHAGIKPLEDASWVGLGWNLNPGAINRVVSGYPDDHNKVERFVEDFWEGGETHFFSVGINVGNRIGLGGDLGFTISHDTYRGFGGDISMGLSFSAGGISVGSGMQASASGATFSGLRYSAATMVGDNLIGVSTNVGTNSASIGMSYNNTISTGIRMDSKGLKPSLSVAGNAASVTNNKAGRISTQSFGFSVPVSPMVSIGYNYLRYWMHERDATKTFGTLYAKDAHDYWDETTTIITPGNGTLMKKRAHLSSFDSHAIFPPEADFSNEDLDADEEMGGALPSYDRYSISAQGLSGQIEPLILENGSLFNKVAIQRQSDGTSYDVIDYYEGKEFTKKVNLRFINDFSNSHRVTTLPTLSEDLSQIDEDDQYTQAGEVVNVNNIGFNSTDQHLAGSKHVEWFSNAEILANDPSITSAKDKGFIDYSGSSIGRTSKWLNTGGNSPTNYDIQENIGGFSVTNESGVTYHYALPVYSFDELHYSRTINQDNGDTWNKQDNPAPYAYTWLLTSITGSDFIDKNDNGIADENDWGYWINFNYGKWVDDYQWRTPSVGYTKDINSKVEYYSYGKKEIYYLDAIQTRTHTALFVKDIRNDAKGVQNEENGDFKPYRTQVDQDECNHYAGLKAFAVVNKGKSSMKLNKIVLLKNDAISSVTTNGIEGIKSIQNNYQFQKTVSTDKETYGGDCPTSLSVISNYTSINNHLGDNVFDKDDYNSIQGSISSNILKSIEFNTDYSLAPETANSFDSNLFYNNHNTTKTGKLTLNSVTIKGSQNTNILPPVNFEYNISNPYVGSCTITSNNEISSSNTSIQEGDILKIDVSNGDAYVLIEEALGGNNYKVQYLGEVELTPNAQSYNFEQTKNPPFNAKKYDYWSFYKSDFNGDVSTSSTHFRRHTSDLSSLNTDVWSLREIENSVGGKTAITYQSKKFSDIVLENKSRLNISSMYENATPNTTNEYTIRFHEDIDLTRVFDVGDNLLLHVPTSYFNGDDPNPGFVDKILYSDNITVQSVLPDRITIQNPLINSGNYYRVTFDQGFVDFDNNHITYGDGCQVQKVGLTSNGESHETIYNYTDGIVSYLPSQLNIVQEPADRGTFEFLHYKQAYYHNFLNLIKIANIVPAPNIMYENVIIQSKSNGIDIPGEMRYQFRVFDAGMIDNTSETTPVVNTSGFKTRNHVIRDKTVQIGNLVKSEQLNGKGQIISLTVYDYADDGTNLDGSNDSESDYGGDIEYQGILEQSFTQVKKVIVNGVQSRQGIVTAYKRFPNILMGTKTTQNGVTTTSLNLKFDFYTGEPTVVETENSYGEKFRATSTPAYQIAEYGAMGTSPTFDGMGLKVHNIHNKHMLTQNAATQLEKLDQSGNSIGFVSASVTTWNDTWNYIDQQNSDKVWRKHKSFTYIDDRKDEDGTFANTFNPFNWTPNATQHTNWQQTSEITLYDHYSKPLEVKDINGDYAATHMGHDETVVVATVANAKYKEFAHATAELGTLNGTTFDGGVQKVSGSLSGAVAHSGTHSLNTSGEGFKFTGRIGTDIDATRTYRASVWINDNGNSAAALGFRFPNSSAIGTEVAVNSTDIQAGTWKLLTLDITIPSGATGDIEIYTDAKGTATYFDDFRFHPIDAPMTSYVYDENTGQLRYILDAENFFTEYEYNTDGSGRLWKTYRESTEVPTGKRIVSKHEINFKN